MSTFGSIRRRVPILNGEYYNFWRDEMLDIFDEFYLSKYIHNPYVPLLIPCILLMKRKLTCFVILEPSILSIEDYLRLCLVVCETLHVLILYGMI